MSCFARAASITFGLVIATLTAAELPAPPQTPRKPVEEVFHGTRIVDDYKWLEDAKDPAVLQWTEEQNRYSRVVLDQFTALPALRQRIQQLMSHRSPDYLFLTAAGGRLFALKTQPPKE